MQRRVAHVISTPRGVGGAERVLEWLVDGATARGWEVVILNPFDEDPDGSGLQALFGDRYRAAHHAGPTGALTGRRWLRHELARFAPDIVHAHLFHALVLVASLPRSVVPVRVLSQQHGDYLAWQGRRLQRALDRWSERRFDRVIACSGAVRDIVVDGFGVLRERVDVIRNGWTGEPLPPTRGDGPLRVVCVANLRREKNHAMLLRAYARVRASAPDTRLVLVGTGPLEGDVRAEIDRLGVGDGVELVGAVDDVWPHLAAADVFALASQFEPLGIVLLEAMASGLPVVTTRVGGIPEIVQEGVTGLLVDSGDDAGFALALESLLLDQPRREEMGAAARAEAAPLHSDRMVARYFDVYEGLLRARTAGQVT